jgi:hypothetical protein
MRGARRDDAMHDASRDGDARDGDARPMRRQPARSSVEARAPRKTSCEAVLRLLTAPCSASSPSRGEVVGWPAGASGRGSAEAKARAAACRERSESVADASRPDASSHACTVDPRGRCPFKRCLVGCLFGSKKSARAWSRAASRGTASASGGRSGIAALA